MFVCFNRYMAHQIQAASSSSGAHSPLEIRDEKLFNQELTKYFICTVKVSASPQMYPVLIQP